MDVDQLLSDDFVEFSKQIAEIHAEKKKMTEEFKVKYEEFQRQVKELGERAEQLKEEFEACKAQGQIKEE